MRPILALSVRELNEIKLALLYVFYCDHGTPGHNRLRLIAAMASHIGISFSPASYSWTIPENVLILDENGEPVTTLGMKDDD